MTIHHKESCMLQVEISIYIDQRIIANLRALVSTIPLNRILSQRRCIFRSFIFCKIPDVTTQFCCPDMCNLKLQIEVTINIECRDRNDILITGILICEDIFPVNRTQVEILTQFCCQHGNRSRLLFCRNRKTGILVGRTHVIGLTEISIVFDVVKGYTQLRLRLLQGKESLYMRMDFFVRCLVPPEMACMIMAEIEIRFIMMDI